MNRSELIESLATRKKLTVKKSEAVITTIFAAMTEALCAGDRIEIRGFGSFVIREYAPYTGRNPKTGESIGVQPKKLPFFKVGKEIRERLSGE
jgi:integration host factor subunit beta